MVKLNDFSDKELFIRDMFSIFRKHKMLDNVVGLYFNNSCWNCVDKDGIRKTGNSFKNIYKHENVQLNHKFKGDIATIIFDGALYDEFNKTIDYTNTANVVVALKRKLIRNYQLVLVRSLDNMYSININNKI